MLDVILSTTSFLMALLTLVAGGYIGWEVIAEWHYGTPRPRAVGVVFMAIVVISLVVTAVRSIALIWT